MTTGPDATPQGPPRPAARGTATPPGKPLAPRRNPHRRLLRIAAGLVIASVAFAFSLGNVATRHTTTWYCEGCAAYRVIVRRGLGAQDGDPFLASSRDEATTPTAVTAEVFGGRHEHHWTPNGASSHLFGLRTLIACNGPLPNPIAWDYAREGGPSVRPTRLRPLVAERLASGALSRDLVRALFELPRRPPAADAADPARVALYREAAALLADAGAGDAPWEWSEVLGGR